MRRFHFRGGLGSNPPNRDRNQSDFQRISKILTVQEGQPCDTPENQNPKIPHEYAQRRKIGPEGPDGGSGGRPSDGGSFFDFMGFCGSVDSPGWPEWQGSTGVIVRNPSEKPPFCPGWADEFETRPTGTGFPELRWLALLASFSSIRHTSARSGNRIKGGLP